MIRKAVITIPTPCHENWEKMSNIEKGKFCGSCQKNVYDFTKSSDREILQKFNQEKNLCGRFLNTQLNREMVIPKEKSSMWMAAASAAVTFLGLGNDDLQAQTQTKGEVVQTDIRPQMVGKIAMPSTKSISGVVSDSAGPLPGANVTIKGTDIATQTDIDGKYTLMAKPGDVILASFVGMEVVQTTVGKSSTYDLILPDSALMLGAVVVSGTIKVKPMEVTQAGAPMLIESKIEKERKRNKPKK